MTRQQTPQSLPQSPKDKLIATAAEMIYRRGWNATGINKILAEASVPKGSFYYYFRSKEELGAALVRYYGERARERHARTLLNPELSARQGFEAYFNERAEEFRAAGWRWGCPIGSICNETADSSEAIATVAREELEGFREAVEAALERGTADGSIKVGRAVNEISWSIARCWQGALLHMKAFHSEEPLRLALKDVFSLLDAGGR